MNMYKKEYYQAADADYNRTYIINEERAYNELMNIFKTLYRLGHINNQAYCYLKPRLERIVSLLEYSEGFERYRGWKHDLTKELIKWDYNDYIDYQESLKEGEQNV